MATKKKSEGASVVVVQPAAAPKKRAPTKRAAPAKKKKAARRSGGGGKKASEFETAVKGAVAGAVLVKYLQSDGGKKMTAESQFYKDHGMGPYVAGAGYAVTKLAPKYRSWGLVMIGAGAFLWGAHKTNASSEEADRVQVQGPTLNELAEADLKEEMAARQAAQQTRRSVIRQG
ncbi:MAG: hypothetical protein QM519_02335 [Bacteroidia bacterium]|nr:hypothetical protein [Bacteroidia bacterium]